MLSGYRLSVLALGLGLGLGPALADPPRSPQQSASTEQGDTQGQEDAAALPVNQHIEADQYTAPCAKNQDQRDSDLCAQWRAADAATEAARWGFWQTWISIGSLVLGLATMAAAVAAALFAKKAADETGKGATAAEAQVKLSRHALEGTERAFVFHDGMRWISHRTDDGKIFWRIRPAWVNTGSTPTRQLRVVVSFRLSDADVPDNFDFNLSTDFDYPAVITPNGGRIESMACDLADRDLSDLANGKKHFHVWGEARYRDIFETTPIHVTRFCVFVQTVTGDPTRYWHATDNPVEMRFVTHPRHNCMDEECNG